MDQKSVVRTVEQHVAQYALTATGTAAAIVPLVQGHGELDRKVSIPDVDDELLALSYADATAHGEALYPVASGVGGPLPVVVISGLLPIKVLPFEEVPTKSVLAGGVRPRVDHLPMQPIGVRNIR